MDEKEKSMRELAKTISSKLSSDGMGSTVLQEGMPVETSTEDLLLEYFKIIFDKADNPRKLSYNENAERQFVQFDIVTRNANSVIDATFTNTIQCRLDDSIAAIRHAKTMVSLNDPPREGLELEMIPTPAIWMPLDPIKTELHIRQQAETIIGPLVAAGYTDSALNSLNENEKSLTDQMIEYIRVMEHGVANERNLPIMQFTDDPFGFISLKSKGTWNEKPVNLLYLLEYNNNDTHTSFKLTNIAASVSGKDVVVEQVRDKILRPEMLISSAMRTTQQNRKPRNRNQLPGMDKGRTI